MRTSHKGISVPRFHTSPDKNVYEMFKWRFTDVELWGKDAQNKPAILFRQEGAEVPAEWSDTAARIVYTKYARGHVGAPDRESSVRQIVGRVVARITEWGRKGHYFASRVDEDAFRDELTYLLLDQQVAFNSPVWFNLGVEGVPQQASACFINHIDDSMESIMDVARTESILFKGGSGSGINMSPLRSKLERLSGTGYASGPVSFMRGFDAFAGAIKSGGKTRRAAKMVILNADHPDILDFIHCKVTEQRRIHDLHLAGWDMTFDSEEMKGIQFQNANNSVRLLDRHMKAVQNGGVIDLRARTTGEIMTQILGQDLWNEIAAAAHQCGDPGLQFHDTINAWHTAPQLGDINSSNPCSEYMFLDDTACNLASLNLRKFFKRMYQASKVVFQFLKDKYHHAVRTTALAMEIMVGFADYPTEKIGKASKAVRTLGLGYANLGALLMEMGLPYDSFWGRHLAAALTSLMTSAAYLMSAQVSRDCGGPFTGYEKDPMMKVIQKHATAAQHLKDFIDAGSEVGTVLAEKAVPMNTYSPSPPSFIQAMLREMAEDGMRTWKAAADVGRRFGFRNAQATVLAPTGTIGFLMDCDTTGVEPGTMIEGIKTLVGGGVIQIAMPMLEPGLESLGYDVEQRRAILAYVAEPVGKNGFHRASVVGAPHLLPQHYPVFDCAFPCSGGRFLSVDAHIEMMAAVQPFLSGAISKTVNLPRTATVDDIKEAFFKAWTRGLKAIAVYRDGSKDQPVKTAADQLQESMEAAAQEPRNVERVRLPDDVDGPRHKFVLAGHKGYIHTGLYPTGRVGEIFVRMAKEGSTVRGLLNALAKTISIALQHGVPVEVITEKLIGDRYEPSGYTGNPLIPRASSLTDYLGRWMRLKFQKDESAAPAPEPSKEKSILSVDNPTCSVCGSITVKTGTCHTCPNCGQPGGCS